jgi:hypothetical protein
MLQSKCGLPQQADEVGAKLGSLEEKMTSRGIRLLLSIRCQSPNRKVTRR